MKQQVKWPTPRLPVEKRTTFGIYAPTQTHTRPASCAEVECEQYLKGWRTVVIEGSGDESLLRRAAAGVVDGRGVRRYLMAREGAGFVAYTFPQGQPCFAATRHRVTLDRPMLHVIRGGDWRASFDAHAVSGEQWVNEFGGHQDRLARAINGSPS